jgi:hypothetical protein
MEAYFYANNTAQIFSSVDTPGHRVVGELELPPGSYVVFAKADIGTNVAGGYPPPPWPHGGGVTSLSFGGVRDAAYAALRPESGSNIETVALMVAAESARTRRARLYFLTGYPLRVVVNSVRLTAIRVDKLHSTIVGVDYTNLPEEESLFANFALATGIHARSLEKFGDD